MCGTAQHAETGGVGWADRAPTPADDLLWAGQADNAGNDRQRNPSRVAKRQRDLLKDYFNNLGAMAGQEDRI